MKELNTEYIHILPDGNTYVKVYRDGILCEQVLVGRFSSYKGKRCIFENDHGRYVLEGDINDVITDLESLCISYLELPW